MTNLFAQHVAPSLARADDDCGAGTTIAVPGFGKPTKRPLANLGRCGKRDGARQFQKRANSLLECERLSRNSIPD
jgi:hypothetical protein